MKTRAVRQALAWVVGVLVLLVLGAWAGLTIQGYEQRKEYAEQAAHERPATVVEVKIATWTEVLGVGTLLLAAATVVLVWQTRRLVDEGANTARRQLRAYIALENIGRQRCSPGCQGEACPELTHRAEIRVQNYGQTPAHEVTLRIGGTDGVPGSALPQSYTYSATPLRPAQMLHPKQAFTFTDTGVRTDLEWDNLIWGSVVYCDIFDDWWETQFCYVFRDGAPATVVGEHNRERSHGKTRPF